MLSLLLRARDEDGPGDDRRASCATSCSRCSPPGTRRRRPSSRSRSSCCCATRRCSRGCATSSTAGEGDAYLDAVVKETLRLRPVIDAAERTLTKPRDVAGWELPAGRQGVPRDRAHADARGSVPARARVPARAVPRGATPSRTRGSRSAAASGAVSARRSRRRRSPRCCARSSRRSSCGPSASDRTRSCSAGSRSRRATAWRSR